MVISKDFSLEHWIELTQLAEYYSINHLKKICEQELFAFAHQNCEKLMNLSLNLGLTSLSMYCADYQIKMMVSKEEKYQIEYNECDNERLNQKREEMLKEVYGLLRFDILQTRIEA